MYPSGGHPQEDNQPYETTKAYLMPQGRATRTTTITRTNSLRFTYRAYACISDRAATVSVATAFRRRGGDVAETLRRGRAAGGVAAGSRSSRTTGRDSIETPVSSDIPVIDH